MILFVCFVGFGFGYPFQGLLKGSQGTATFCFKGGAYFGTEPFEIWFLPCAFLFGAPTSFCFDLLFGNRQVGDLPTVECFVKEFYIKVCEKKGTIGMLIVP